MNYKDVVEKAHVAFASGRTRDVNFREKQLESLLKMYEDNANEMAEVLAQDLRRHKQEATILEIEFLINDLKNTLFNLKEWVKPDKVTFIILQINYKYLNFN